MNIVSQSLRLPAEQNKYTSRAEGKWVWNGDATVVNGQWQLAANSGSTEISPLTPKTDRQQIRWADAFNYQGEPGIPNDSRSQYFNYLLRTPWNKTGGLSGDLR